MLHQVSYQELKSLMLQYPYAANLRYLMLVKSLMDKNKEQDRNLILASLSSIDRRKLRQLVLQYDNLSELSDNFEIDGEVLELKDLSTLEEVLASEPAKEETPPAHAAIFEGNEEESSFEFLNEIVAVTPPVETDENVGTATEEEKPNSLEDLLFKETDDPSTTEQPTAALADGAANRMAASDIEDLGTGDEEDEEIEESLDGLFDVEYQEPIVAAEPEYALTEPNEETDNADGGTADDNAPPASEAQSGAADKPEETPKSIEDIPLEITNDEPMLENEPDPSSGQPAPSPKTAFSSYRKVHHHKTGLLAGRMNVFPKKETSPEMPDQTEPIDQNEEPEDVAKDMATDSLTEDHSIATETLAGILARQGHFDKAIKMYEKLSLQYPEKSSTFAAKIEKLRRK